MFRCLELYNSPLPLLLLSLTLSALVSTGCSSVTTADPFADTARLFSLSDAADDAYGQGRWLEAARLYRQIADQVPEDAHALFRLGNIHTRLGEYEQAIAAYNDALKRDSREPRAWYNLATAYLLNAEAALLRARSDLSGSDPVAARIDVQLRELREIVYHPVEALVSPVNDRVVPDNGQEGL